MFYVYILQGLKDKRTYVRFTNNVEQRLKKHNSGQARSTKHRRPFKLFTESFKTEQEAKKRELWRKSGTGRRKIKEIFNKLTEK